LLLLCDWNFGHCRSYQAEKPPVCGTWICLNCQVEGGMYCVGPIGKSESHCLITCSDCSSYTHENICVFSAIKLVTFLDTVYENFAFFSAILLGSMVCTACSFIILHTHLFLIELICVVFIICHCNSVTFV
jgi:hypothetical protein